MQNAQALKCFAQFIMRVTLNMMALKQSSSIIVVFNRWKIISPLGSPLCQTNKVCKLTGHPSIRDQIRSDHILPFQKGKYFLCYGFLFLWPYTKFQKIDNYTILLLLFTYLRGFRHYPTIYLLLQHITAVSQSYLVCVYFFRQE